LPQHFGIWLEEQIACSILAERGKLDADFSSEVLDEELVRNRGHDTGAVTVSSIGPNRTSVGHVTEEVFGYPGQSGSWTDSWWICLPSLTILWLGLPLLLVLVQLLVTFFHDQAHPIVDKRRTRTLCGDACCMHQRGTGQ
jgi:hypothetical protein